MRHVHHLALHDIESTFLELLHNEHAFCLCLFDIGNVPDFTKLIFRTMVNSERGCSSAGIYLRISQEVLYKGRHILELKKGYFRRLFPLILLAMEPHSFMYVLYMYIYVCIIV